MRITSICVMLACLACQACAQDAASARGVLKRGLLSNRKPTTTTTTPAPQESDYVDEGEYPSDESEQQGPPEEMTSEAPSSTEGKRLVGGGVRPFRSNTDLLESLKKRRAQAAEEKHSRQQAAASGGAAPQEAASDAPPAKASNFNGKKRFSSGSRGDTAAASEDAPAPAAAPAPAKPARNRFSRPSSRATQPEPEAEDQNNEAAQTRNTRTFSRRGGN